MSVLEFKQEYRFNEPDILLISEFVINAIELKDSVKSHQTITSKESILDSPTNMLETILTLDASLKRERKVEVIHLLSKLKAYKEH